MKSRRLVLGLLLPLCLTAAMGPAPADADDALPAPKWLFEITRVAYTDLPNTQRVQDWPEKVIADFAAAGVQMMFSRAHSGESWPGLGWKSKYGELAPGNNPLAATKTENGTAVTVPNLDIHCLVVAETGRIVSD